MDTANDNRSKNKCSFLIDCPWFYLMFGGAGACRMDVWVEVCCGCWLFCVFSDVTESG